MAWAENNYIETRFVGGMNCSVEPHTLDRDTGELPDIMNMMCRTQGLRTRKGWERISDLSAEYGTMPLNAPSALFNFEYEPDLPPESTGEEGEDVTDGGAVLPYVDDGGGSSGGGHGGGGSVKPKVEPADEPADEPVSAWSVTGPASIYPYVPFDLTITRNSGTSRAAWVYGLLSPSSAGNCKWTNSYPSETSTGVWKSRVVVKNLKRSIEDVIFKAGASPSAYGQCEIDYALYGFYPDLPDAVTNGEEFEFSVECRDMNVITGYQGAGREVYLSWKFLNGSGQEVQGSVSVLGSSWRNGVMTGRAIASTTAGVTLRLTATFLGEEHSDDAAINAGEVNIEVDECPIALHIYGKGSTLQISATGGFSPSHLSVSCQLNGQAVSINDVLELATSEGGSRTISFASGWSATNVWSKDVRAKSVSANGGSTLHITFAYANGEERFTATADIEIEKTIEGTLAASPSSIYSGDTVALTATLSGNVDVGLDVSRVPFNLMFLAHADDDGFTVMTDTDITDDENWSEASVNLACQFNTVIISDSAGTLRYSLGFDSEVLAYVDIAVAIPNYKAMLAEAINERILAKTGTAGTYTDQDTASTLRSGAIDCANTYLNGDVASDGSYTKYKSSAPLPVDAAEETASWYKHAYQQVIKVKSYAYDSWYPSAVRRRRKNSGYILQSLNEETNVYEPSSLSEVVANAVSAVNSNAWDIDNDSGPACAIETISVYYSEPDYYTINSGWHVYVSLLCRAQKYRVDANKLYLSALVKIYFVISSSFDGTWETWGHSNAPSSPSSGLAYQSHCSSGQDFETDWICADDENLTAVSYPVSWDGSGVDSFERGYTFQSSSKAVIVLEYDFKHKN